MTPHEKVWNAIDCVAAECNLTASGLARRSGLDNTALNKSKRIVTDAQRPRWPSTETIHKILQTASMTWSQFAKLVEESPRPVMKGHRDKPPLIKAVGEE